MEKVKDINACGEEINEAHQLLGGKGRKIGNGGRRYLKEERKR